MIHRPIRITIEMHHGGSSLVLWGLGIATGAWRVIPPDLHVRVVEASDSVGFVTHLSLHPIPLVQGEWLTVDHGPDSGP